MNQSELEANTWNLRQARENACKQVANGLSFTSDWSRKWGEIFYPIKERSKAKPKQDANYFRHSFENRSIDIPRRSTQVITGRLVCSGPFSSLGLAAVIVNSGPTNKGIKVILGIWTEFIWFKCEYYNYKFIPAWSLGQRFVMVPELSWNSPFLK